MTKMRMFPKDDTAKPAPEHPGMLGDGTEEQNLNQPGHPDAKIGKEEVEKAFEKKSPTK